MLLDKSKRAKLAQLYLTVNADKFRDKNMAKNVDKIGNLKN